MADDKYDHAIDYLMRHPDQIGDAWNNPYEHPAGCLFTLACTDSGWRSSQYETRQCVHGCLTEIRAGGSSTRYTLTIAIAEDVRLPDALQNIHLHHLPVFAEWQRRLDRELGRS